MEEIEKREERDLIECCRIQSAFINSPSPVPIRPTSNPVDHSTPSTSSPRLSYYNDPSVQSTSGCVGGQPGKHGCCQKRLLRFLPKRQSKEQTTEAAVPHSKHKGIYI